MKRIKLDGTCKNDKIDLKKTYLAHTGFGEKGWEIGRFERQWYGLNFVAAMSVVVGTQLDLIDDLYEFTLPKLRKQPTQISIERKRRKKAGECLRCGSKYHKKHPKDDEDEY